MDSLRYAVVYQGAYPPDCLSAGVRRVRDICRGLVRAGGDVCLLTPSHFGNRPASSEEFRVERTGIECDSPSVLSRWAFWSGVVKRVHELNPDLVLFYNTSLDSLRAMIRLRQSGYLIGFEQCDFHSTCQPTLLKRIAYSLSERILPSSSDLTIVITSHIANWVKSVSAHQQVILIPGLFDTTRFRIVETEGCRFRQKHNIEQQEVIVTYAGSWWKTKGVAELIDAFEAAMARTDVPMRLVIAGAYSGCTDYEENVPELIRERSVAGSCVLPGYLDSDEMIGLLSASDVVVSPSLNHPFNHAAFPTKVAEYAGMGRAILATNVGDVPVYFRDHINAVLCDPDSSGSMSDGLLSLVQDPALRKRIGNAAAETARESFDYRKCGAKIDAFVREIMARQKSA